MNRFKIFTLGCKVNQYESRYIRTALLSNGWEDAGTKDEPDPTIDLAVVNTCCVTAESDAKSRKTISRICRLYPNAQIVPMGCFAALDPEKAGAFPRVTGLLTDRARIPDFLRNDLKLKIVPTGISDFGERHRAFIKIQDGCRVRCAYCIIPTVRPVLWSRPTDEIVDEIRHLCDSGYRELVLTGIHLGHYGFDLGIGPCSPEMELSDYLIQREKIRPEDRVTLTGLLKKILSVDFPARLRLGSLEAAEVSDELVETIQKSQGRICSHFHLSMQSGDDTVLQRMRRRTTASEYAQICRSILKRMPNAALTTDIIVGFPGETDEMFQNSCLMVQQLGFSKVHIFRYSRRPGTPAAEMPDQIPEPVKHRRLLTLQKIAHLERERYAKRQIGHILSVLIEEKLPCEEWAGTSESYLTVQFPAEKIFIKPGMLVPVKILSTEGEILHGKLS